MVLSSLGIVSLHAADPVVSASGLKKLQWMCWLVRIESSTSKSTFEIKLTTFHEFSSMYGAAQDEHKNDFLRELVNLAKDNSYLILIGEDFNMLRFSDEKSNDRFGPHRPFLFNGVIDSLNLREVGMMDDSSLGPTVVRRPHTKSLIVYWWILIWK